MSSTDNKTRRADSLPTEQHDGLKMGNRSPIESDTTPDSTTTNRSPIFSDEYVAALKQANAHPDELEEA